MDGTAAQSGPSSVMLRRMGEVKGRVQSGRRHWWRQQPITYMGEHNKHNNQQTKASAAAKAMSAAKNLRKLAVYKLEA